MFLTIFIHESNVLFTTMVISTLETNNNILDTPKIYPNHERLLVSFCFVLSKQIGYFVMGCQGRETG